MLPVSSFDFDLPPELIAQDARARGRSRLLVVDRAEAAWREAAIGDLPSLLTPGDLVVANDTRVFPARLLGRRDPSGGAVECVLLERQASRGAGDPGDASEDEWHALVHPGQKLKPGARIIFEDPTRAPGVRVTGTILEQKFFGRRLIRLATEGAERVDRAIDAIGHVPLPPYIHRPDRADDRERYQTVYARERGSIAAPTAGLHFDQGLLDALRGAGIGWQTVTHHVGYGTFKPVRAPSVEEHTVDAERYAIAPDAARAIHDTRRAGRRIVAIGTTTTRALESAAQSTGQVEAGSGSTDLFIFPGYRFQVVDALLTNFHLPRSSLLMLVAAFAGLDLTVAAYRDAVERRFHFYSYGDAMLIL